MWGFSTRAQKRWGGGIAYVLQRKCKGNWVNGARERESFLFSERKANQSRSASETQEASPRVTVERTNNAIFNSPVTCLLGLVNCMSSQDRNESWKINSPTPQRSDCANFLPSRFSVEFAVKITKTEH